MHVIHISKGGPVQRIRSVCGRIWTFEMHPYCGPIVVNPATEVPLSQQPGEKSPFWEAVHAWMTQGLVVDASGVCAWTKAAKPKLVHLGGSNYTLVGSRLAKRAASQPQGEQKP